MKWIDKEQMHRRKFLEKIQGAAGATILAGSLPWINLLKAEPSGTVAPSDKARIGIIGVGSRGKYLLERLKEIPSMEIAAICDDYDPHYDEALQLTEGKAKGYKDYRKLLEQEDIDGVVIATPLYLHSPMTVDAFDAEKHVFCEKAMAMNVDETLAMSNARAKANKVLQIGHQRMFDLKYLKALDQIRGGRLGQITQIRAYWHRNDNWRRPVPKPELERKINWRLYRDYSRGLITELGSHHFQVAFWVLDEMPISVSGFGGLNFWKDGREVYDNINLVFEYKDGTHFVYDSMISNKKYGVEVQVMGNLGTMELEKGYVFKEAPPTGEGAKEFVDHNWDNITKKTDAVSGATWEMEMESNEKGMKIMENEVPDSTKLQLEGFVEAVKQNKHQKELERQALAASLMAMHGYEAMINKKRVKIPEYDGLKS